MKKLVSILLITAFSVSSITRVFTIVDFKINQDYIARVLCINKDKPASTCNGKCHLAKQLKAQTEQEEKQLPQNSKQKIEVLFTESSSIAINHLSIFKKEQTVFYNYFRFNPSDYSDQVFQPPKFS